MFTDAAITTLTFDNQHQELSLWTTTRPQTCSDGTSNLSRHTVWPHEYLWNNLPDNVSALARAVFGFLHAHKQRDANVLRVSHAQASPFRVPLG